MFLKKHGRQMKAPYRPSLKDILFLRRPSCWKNLPPLKSAQAFQKMNTLQERRIYSSSSSIDSSSVSSSSSSSSESSREEPNSSENSSSSSSSLRGDLREGREPRLPWEIGLIVQHPSNHQTTLNPEPPLNSVNPVNHVFKTK